MAKICMDHLGNIYGSINEMCSKYGVSVKTYLRRIDKGLTTEIALTGVELRKKPIKLASGKEYSSITELCNAYNISFQGFNRNLKKGYSVDESLRIELDKQEKVTDPFGNIFSTVEEMCKEYGINPNLYRTRMQKGWNQLVALTFPSDRISPFPKKAGINFENVQALADFLNTSSSVIRLNLKRGCTYNELIEEKIVLQKTGENTVYETAYIYGFYYQDKPVYVGQTHNSPETRKKQHVSKSEKGHFEINIFIKNHPETEFRVIKELHNVSQNELDEAEIYWIGYYDTFYHGCNMTKGGSGIKRNGKKTYDHLGNVFESFEDMANHYGINPNTLQGRLNSGMSLKKALTIPVGVRKGGKKNKCYDHLGNEFVSLTEMAKYYGLTKYILNTRKNMDWDLKKILTTPVAHKTRRTIVAC